MLSSFLVLFLIQAQVPLKAKQEFEIVTKYELKNKPAVEGSQIVFDQAENKKSSSTDLLPYLSLTLKVKKWVDGITQLKITDNQGKIHLRKKPTDEGLYSLDMGFVDDMKDKVTPGKFFVVFLREKKTIEQITIEVEEDGTFLVNGEKRGKF